jgi:glycosyltransferase involved in cell wall biosynthesis
MKSKKIIHLITTIERGGAEKQLLILATEQIIQGLEVEVIFLKGLPELKDEFEKNGIKVNSSIANKNFITQIRLLRSYFKENLDLVHTHLPKSEVAAFLSGIKKRYVITRHNYELFWPNAPKFVACLLSRITSRSAVGGIAISEALKTYLLENREVSKKFPFQVIYYGFEKKLDSNSIKTSHVLDKYNLGNEIFKIGIISRLVPGKDYPTFFKALSEVLTINKNVFTFVVGDGYQRKYLYNLSKELKIERQIIWLGKIDHVPEFLSELDLFVFTSKGEGFGLVLLEAMLASRPILAANNSAIPEVLGKDYAGLFKTGDFIDLAQKISMVMENKVYSKGLVKSYQQQVKLFDPKLMAKNVISFYEYCGL